MYCKMCFFFFLKQQDCIVNSQSMLNWDHQQQYFEQMHLLNAIPSHLSPLSSDNNINNQFYQQPNYQQSHHLMPHNTILEKDNNDYVLIKVLNLMQFFAVRNRQTLIDFSLNSCVNQEVVQ